MEDIKKSNVQPSPPLPVVGPEKPRSRFAIHLKFNWREWPRGRKVFFVSSLLVLILLIAWGIWLVGNRTQPAAPVVTTEVTPEPVPEPTTKEHLLSGVVVDKAIYNRRPVAVMIENSQAARPQTGLTSADLVYEAVTEGGITRFMAVFSQKYPDKAGPVRSARSYFIDWLSEYDAIYAHAGGSPTALGRIGEYSIKDYPHSNDVYYREAQAGLASEHTLYLDVGKLFLSSQSKRGWSGVSDFPSWLFKDPAATVSQSKPITINFSSAPFKVIWRFDEVNNLYLRELSGAPHKDKVSGEQITAKTIVAMTVNHAANPPYKGTGKESEWNMSTIGTGAVSVFFDGNKIDGIWKKPSRTERTRFYDASGNEIKLNRGKIWIEVVPQEGTVTWQ